MTEAKVSQFDNIYLGVSSHIGKLRMAMSGIGWKASQINKLHTIKSDDMVRFHWMRSVKQYELAIATKDGSVVRFLNFQRDDFETLKDIVKSFYKQSIEVKEMSLKGWNWGKAEFEGADLVFNVEDKPMFEIPLNQVANTNLVGKNEVSIEFSQPEDPEKSKSKSNDMDELVEVRFYIPTSSKANAKKDDEKENGSDKDSNNEESEEDEQTQSAAQTFYQSIKSRADLTTSGEAICMFPDTLLLMPRGRYDIDMFSTFLRLRGKTYDYKLLYNQIMNLFLLPKPDDTLVMFVLEIDPPLRQGQTRYPFLVLQFNKEEELEMDLTFDDALNESKFAGKLEKHYDAPKFEVVSNVFRAITKRKIAVPGTYRSHHGAMAFKASFKANEGLMYPMEKCIIFAPKPVVLLPLSEIASVTFSRVGGSTSAGSRTFDLKINLKSGVNHSFSSVNREEYPYIETYLKSKKIKYADEAQEESLLFKDLGDDSDDSDIVAKEMRASGDEDDESEDEDFIGGSSSSDSEASGDDDDIPDDDDEGGDDESPTKKQKK